MARPVLVTGGAGYIGSHAAKALARAGYLPVTYDNLGHGHRAAVRWGPLEEGDLLDPARLDVALRKWRPEAVLHFAGLISVGESVENPGLYYQHNLVGSLNLMQALRTHGVGRFVFSSTAAVYGAPEIVPISESAPLRPLNPYGSSKAMVEAALADFGRAHGLRSVALRYFNAAGADPDGETGEAHEPETHLIPLALDALAGRRGALTVYGDDYPTSDGTCLRDYVHVSDLATAHVQALEYTASCADGTSAAFNLGSGTGFTVRQVLDSIARVSGKNFPVRLGPRRPGDSTALVADAAMAREVLGWEPRLSDIDTIVRTALAWTSRREAA
jgi:UDP-glucose-4-epimerase GalE